MDDSKEKQLSKYQPTQKLADIGRNSTQNNEFLN